MTIDAYEKRIIAYADILGWRNASKDPLEKGRLEATANKIKEHALNFSKEIKKKLKDTPAVSKTLIQEHASIEFSFFSDSFAVSAPVDYGDNIFGILSWASDYLLREKFLVRGGVTIGGLYHHQDIIFGPALVEAVELEQKKAHYPCLLCSKELVKYLEQTDYKDKVVLTDSNQKSVVNIACGEAIARDELMTIVQGELSKLSKSYKSMGIFPCLFNFTHRSERIMRKWRYTQEMLPRMYERSIHRAN